jgi:hypothetical protein
MALLLAPVFLAAFVAGVFGLIWFDLHVLELGDPKFRTSVGFYFWLWSAFYSPIVIAALVFLLRSHQEGWRLWRLAAVYLALIFVALELSVVFDVRWIVLLLEFAILGFLFWKIQKITDRIGYA